MSFVGDIPAHHFQSLFAIVAHFVTFSCVEILAKERELQLTSANIRFLAVAENAVECMKVLILSILGAVVIVDYEVIISLSVAVRIIQNTFSFLAVSSTSTAFLDVAF